MKLEIVVDHLYRVLVSRDLYYINPVNMEKEKKRFLDAMNKENSYTPLFYYRKLRFDAGLVKKEISQLKRYRGENEKIIHLFAERCKNYLYLYLNRGKADFTKYSIKVFGTPDKEAIAYSRNILKKYKPEYLQRNLKSHIVAERLQRASKKYGWRVSLKSNLSSRIQLHRPTKTIQINKDALFSQQQIKRIVVHEVDTHIKRDFNNARNIKPLFQKCLDYIETEEGLAMKNEEKNKCLDIPALRTCAARVIAVDLSLRKGFLDVFREIKTYGFEDDIAFDITIRAKRGLSDTNKSGAFTRDHIYISGKLKIDEFLTKKHTLKELFLGKIGINDIGSLNKIRNERAS